VFHEVLVGVPLHMVRLWAFWGLMAQVGVWLGVQRRQGGRLHDLSIWCFP
jgi:hypothetical protein